MIMHFFNIKLLNNKSKKIIKLDTKINNNSKFNSTHNKNLKKEIISNSSKNILSENQIKNKSKILISIKKLEKLKDLKKYKIKKIKIKYILITKKKLLNLDIKLKNIIKTILK